MTHTKVAINMSSNTFGCRSAEWVAFLHEVVMVMVVMCHVHNTACTPRERYINGRSIKKCLHILFEIYLRHSKDQLNAKKYLTTNRVCQYNRCKIEIKKITSKNLNLKRNFISAPSVTLNGL